MKRRWELFGPPRRVTRESMGNQSGHELSQAEIGRRPSDHEMMVLLQLQRKLFTRLVQSPEHLALLKRYWDSHFVNKHKAPVFEQHSSFWCTEGGFTTENPGDDLRSMGELGLQCLVFFAEQYPGEARMMKRAKGGYPFVKAAMAVARSLCETLHVVDETGKPGRFPVVETLYWQVLQHEESFYRLFSLCFLLFEELYCEEIARDRTLPVTQQIPTSVVAELVDAMKRKLLAELQKAPLQLENLQSLCPNASHILKKTDTESTPGKATNRSTRSASVPAIPSIETDRMAAWKQHHTTRKSMRAAAKCWSASFPIPEESVEPLSGVAPRLVPRAPEISFATSETPRETVDLFEGLTTKSVGETRDTEATGAAQAAS